MFHVVVWMKGSEDRADLLFHDLSEAELRSKFLRPYGRGLTVARRGDLYNTRDIASVRIIETAITKDEALAEYIRADRAKTDELNRTSRHIFMVGRLSAPEDWEIIDAGESVTERFVSGPPGSKNVLVDALNHPWMLTVVGGIVATVAATILLTLLS